MASSIKRKDSKEEAEAVIEAMDELSAYDARSSPWTFRGLQNVHHPKVDKDGPLKMHHEGEKTITTKETPPSHPKTCQQHIFSKASIWVIAFSEISCYFF